MEGINDGRNWKGERRNYGRERKWKVEICEEGWRRWKIYEDIEKYREMGGGGGMEESMCEKWRLYEKDVIYLWKYGR